MGSVAANLSPSSPVTLDDKWTFNQGRILLNGTQALARVLLAQKWLDGRKGLKTAGYVSGYRGSPLGNVDTALWSISDRLNAADILFVPGVNEDIAATAVRGSQQIDLVPKPLYDGVFAAWYGKGPGVDRSGDALKHGNFGGAHLNGGVLVIYGDDHPGKSSTVAHHSEQALAACYIPSLYPANVAEIIEYGLMAYAMSRFSGAWVGMKCVNEVVEQTASVDLDLEAFSPVIPDYGDLPPEGVHYSVAPVFPARQEQIAVEHRLPLIKKFVRENRIDRTIIDSPKPRIGLVTAGKSYADTRQALSLLGLTDERAAALGLSLYKVGCIWPLETIGAVEFARKQEVLFFIEEKDAFVEPQLAAALVNERERPIVIGKRDEDGKPLVPSTLLLDPASLALQIAERLEKLGIMDEAVQTARARLAKSNSAAQPAVSTAKRSPYFCSGCPHNRSTQIPEGSLSMTGIGCHSMALFVKPDVALAPTHMGAEGANWMGLAPFSGTKHIFQNMGDGTYYHSGLLAIRAAVASGVNITYKILYNDAVAMTGGQPVDGPISVAEIAHQVIHEGVKTVILLSDNPDAHRNNPDMPPNVRIGHRDTLDQIQRELREMPGCTVLIYEQTCAAEKRRRRKRSLFPDPPKRLFISSAVCEGCGDCSVQSTCVSLVPNETDFGTKRKIDQSSCNKDYSCLNGFCPSFITVYDAGVRKPEGVNVSEELFASLPQPALADIESNSFNVLVTGIGGTGVITVTAILGMAAHIEGKATSIYDMTGLAQKNGAVFSHMRIASDPSHIHAQRIGREEADLLLAFDVVAALSDEARSTLSASRTRVLANSDIATTAAFQFDRNATIDKSMLVSQLQNLVGRSSLNTVDASRLATALMGDSIASNLFLVGVAAQKGMLPVTVDAIEKAVALNGAAVKFNLVAFRLGRLLVADQAKVIGMLPAAPPVLDTSTEGLIERRSQHLVVYQNETLAQRYRDTVERTKNAEVRVSPESDKLVRAVAQNYAKLLAYKDEYEVARMLTDPELEREIERNFASGGRLAFNLAPPIFGGKPINGRPPKHEFNARWMRPVLKLMARMKGLRGTVWDPFGRTQERRLERELISEYEALVEVVLLNLTPENYDAAVELLSLADGVRGYGPVKEAAIKGYRGKLAGARAKFEKGKAQVVPFGADAPKVA